MKLYNTATRKTEEFIPQDPQNVKIYTCGPTVYDYAHIGNLTAYIYWDLLLRVLLENGYQPRRVLNLTDVGHLASDADDGEDKIEKGAKRSGKTVWEVAKYYGEYFLAKMEQLNLLPPAKVAWATDYIEQDLALVEKLTEAGLTYQISDGIYFDTAKFADYAKFARLDLDHLRAGARVEFNSEKRSTADFAVWKFVLPGEDHAMQWQYLGRAGYPGWHLECSAIIHAELGEPIDIHAGGVDHIPVHHTNEIAQSEAAFGRKLARFWLHGNFITIDGQKISKSLDNTYTIEQLLEAGFEPMDFKLWVLQGHYQSERNFSFSDLAAAQSRRLRWRNAIARCCQGQSGVDSAGLWQRIKDCLDNNLNSAAAFAVIDAGQPDLATWQKIDQVFGLKLFETTPDLTKAQRQLIADREIARATKDFVRADQIRDLLAAQNLMVLDEPHGAIWQYLK